MVISRALGTVRHVRSPNQGDPPMFERFHRKSLTATAAALLAALGVGGVALAQSGNPTQKAASPPSAANAATDLPESASDKPDGPESANDTADAPESANDPADGSEQESGSEKANDDGPGGHADESGNANADHEAQGAK